MKLDSAQKRKLLATTSGVYKAFVALDFFKTRKFKVGEEQLTLLELCEQAIGRGEFKKSVIIEEQVYELELIPEPTHAYRISLKRPLKENVVALRKSLTEYTNHEALALLSSQHFSLDEYSKAQLQVSNRLHDKLDIGGIGKMDLYRSHLVTLNNIIEKLDAEDDISNLLVALATGSGKTYVQTLWVLVMYLSGNNAFFTLPDKLIVQFQNDLRRILPDTLVNGLFLLRQNDDASHAKAILGVLSSKQAKSQIVIASSELILDKHYQQLLKLNSKRTFLIFDEQHLLMKSERRRVRLIELSKKMLSMFLTATPNKETYELCGNRPVAIMSSGQKQAAGQGQFPEIFSEHARNMTDRNELHHYQFWTHSFWQNMLRSLFLRFSNAVQGEQSSAAVSIVENLPFYMHRKADEKAVRWSMQVPMARKMLCIIDDNEALVNFCRALEKSSIADRNVYRDGNVVDRSAISYFFLLPKMEEAIVTDDMQYKREQYLAGLSADEYAIGEKLARKSLKEQLKETIFHNFLEYVLADLSGLDEIEHNRLRKEDHHAFLQMICTRFQLREPEHYQQKLEKLIDKNGAQEIAELLSKVSFNLHYMLQHTPDFFAAFVDNWVLNEELLSHISHIDRDFANLFAAYAKRHLMVSVMTGMQQAETPIAESRPFFGLQEESYHMYQGGALIDKAKRRQHSAMETLNDNSCESRFIPNYLEMSEEICDNYFRLGFVGAYVSNKKTEGFSDRNLHTVINIAESTLSSTNSPETLIQGIGRNRGLDETVVPVYIHAQGRDQKSLFNLEHLKLADYYPELFAAQGKYNKNFIRILGQTVGHEIIAWYNVHVKENETIEPEQLKKQVLKIIAKALRHLNNNNSHNIQLSRAQLTKVISAAMGTLNEEIARINRPYHLPLSVRVLGSFFNFISKVYLNWVRIVPAFLRWKHSWFGGRIALAADAVSKVHPDDVYIKVIKHTDFKTIVAKIGIAKEFNDWLARKAKGIGTTVKDNLGYYLKPELRRSLVEHKKETLIPLLANFVAVDKRELLVTAVKRLPNLVGFIQEHAKQLEELAQLAEGEFEQKVLALLHQIPGLEELTLADMVNCPKQLKDYLALFKHNPLELLHQSEPLKQYMISQLAAYLKGPFLVLATPLFLDKDFQVLRDILTKEEQAELFLQHLMLKTSQDNTLNLSNFAHIVKEFKACFALAEFDSIQGRAEQCAVQLASAADAIMQDYFAHLSAQKVTEMALVVHNKLLPALVNVFPLEYRDEILSSISLEKVKQSISHQGSGLVKVMSGAADEQSVVNLFSLLVTKRLPEPLNMVEETRKAKAFLQDKVAEIMGASKLKLAGKKLLSPFSWVQTARKPQYIYDTAIANLIKSDEFIEAISLLLPFNEWSKLKSLFNQNSASTLQLARALIDEMVQRDDSSSFEPERFVELINTTFSTSFKSSQVVAKNAVLRLSSMQQGLIRNLEALISDEQVAAFAKIARENLLPLLAAYIVDDADRQRFLDSITANNVQLVQYLFVNKEKFTRLKNPRLEQGAVLALELINGFLPRDNRGFVLEQIQHPQEKAELSGAQMVTELVDELLVGYLRSEHFSTILAQVYNPQDLAKLAEFFKDKNRVLSLAKKVSSIGLDKLNEQELLALLQSEEALKDIKSLDRRVDVFSGFMSKLKELDTEALDQNKFVTLVTDTVAPILFHKKFAALVNELIGFLNVEELTVMFAAMDDATPRESAVSILQLKEVINTENKTELQRRFLTVAGGRAIDIDALPIKNVMKKLSGLIEELLDCQCYYHQHDHKGDPYSINAPRLLNVMSPALRDIKVSSGNSLLSYFARRISFFQGVRNGLPESAEVNADANHSRVKVFTRINNHILKPLWWSTNTSQLGYALVKLGRALFFKLQAFGFAMLNGLKMLINLVFPGYYTVSQRNPVSEHYEEAALVTAKKINELSAFDAPTVIVAECPEDAVAHTEHFIARQKSSLAFFATASEVDLDADVIQNIDVAPA